MFLPKRPRARGVRAPALTSALVAAAVLVGCGEDKPQKTIAEMEAEFGVTNAPAAAQEAEAPGEQLIAIKLPKPGWEGESNIQGYFEKYLLQRQATPKNVFQTQVLELVPRPKLEEPPPEEQAAEAVEVVEEERGPLQQYPLADYKLLLIMSGTAIPKAVVVDPKGQAFILQQDTRIGNKGGLVESITQYMVVVKEPEQDKPVKMTIRPPYIDLATQTAPVEEPSEPPGGFVVPSAILGGDRGSVRPAAGGAGSGN